MTNVLSNADAQLRALSAEELDAVSGAEIKGSFTLFGIRVVWGTDSTGSNYVCANSQTHGVCVRD